MLTIHLCFVHCEQLSEVGDFSHYTDLEMKPIDGEIAKTIHWNFSQIRTDILILIMKIYMQPFVH